MSWELESIGYCSNVHPGKNFFEYLEQLKTHSVLVREKLNVDRMGIGLWFSAATAIQLKSAIDYSRLAEFLDNNGLVAYTLNGFPFGDFHQDVVKHDVYLPTWESKERLDFTKLLADLIDRLLTDQGVNKSGSISTLPLGWPGEHVDESWLRQCAANLKSLAKFLEQIENKSGNTVRLAIEPEPGCVLHLGEHVVDFFEKYLFDGTEAENQLVKKFIGVCHDVCHAAVMFEKQSDLLAKLSSCDIGIYKLQVSAAIEARIDNSNLAQRVNALDQLARFAEDRYLHQTCIQSSDGINTLIQDLPEALNTIQESDVTGTVRVHYHVPIFLKEFGYLNSTQQQITDCISWFQKNQVNVDVEVETYAWSVLPEEMRGPVLSDGIVDELNWLQQQIDND